MPGSEPLLVDRVLELLRERADGRGQCRMDAEQVLWAVAAKWPDSPRPRLGEIGGALAALRRAGRIKVKLRVDGYDIRRSFVLIK